MERTQVRYERLYVKVPGTDALRRTASGRLRALTNAGWRETERHQETDYVRVRLERTGHKEPMRKLPPIPAQQGRGRREDQQERRNRTAAERPREEPAPES